MLLSEDGTIWEEAQHEPLSGQINLQHLSFPPPYFLGSAGKSLEGDFSPTVLFFPSPVTIPPFPPMSY